MRSSGKVYRVRAAVLCLCSLFVWSCRKDPVLWRIDNLNNDRVLIFGHGGMGYKSKLPMNSKASLDECLARGADGVEMDLQLSSDSVIFLYHDQWLEDATTCDGAIGTTASAGLKDCLYRKNGKNHALVSAPAYFAGLENIGAHLYTLECKLSPGEKGPLVARFARSLADLILRFHLQEVCLVESQNVAFLGLLEQMIPSVDTYYYCGQLEDALTLMETVPITGLTISMDRIGAAEIREAHTHGLKVSLFGMATEQENLRALQMSPDQVQTDKLKHLLEVYRK